MKPKNIFFLFGFAFFLITLQACSSDESDAQTQETADSMAIYNSPPETPKMTDAEKTEFDSIIRTWYNMDQLEFSPLEYDSIWSMLTADEFNVGPVQAYFIVNKNKFSGKDVFFVLEQVSVYFFMKETREQEAVQQNRKWNLYVDRQLGNMQSWFDKKIIYNCLDNAEPVNTRYIFLENGNLRSYFGFIWNDMEYGTWKKWGNKIAVTLNEKQLEFTENDSMLVLNGNGHSLYKITEPAIQK